MQGMGHMVHALYGWDWNSAELFVCKGLLPPTIPLGTPSSSFAYFSPRGSHYGQVSRGVLLQLALRKPFSRR